MGDKQVWDLDLLLDSVMVMTRPVQDPGQLSREVVCLVLVSPRQLGGVLHLLLVTRSLPRVRQLPQLGDLVPAKMEGVSHGQ